METHRKRLDWIGTARADLLAFPKPVQKGIGDALRIAQEGGKAPSAKPLKGYGGAGVVEIIENYDGDTYRAVYTVRLRHRIYVLHCFQKKSTRGVAMAKRDVELIRSRLREAEALDRTRGEQP
jgi:phage-related protein